MDFKDYYASLGVNKTATEKEIKQAYRKLARKFHPDLNPGDKRSESRFKEINEAYEVLGEAENRRKYDELGANWRMYDQGQAGGGSRLRSRTGRLTRAARRVGYRSVSPEEFEEMFGGEESFSDFFNTFFGGGGEAPRAARGSRAATRESPPERLGRRDRDSS